MRPRLKALAPSISLEVEVVKHLLKLVTFRSERLFVSIGRHVNRWRNVNARFRKRFWNLKLIPTRQFPIASQRHRHRYNWMTSLLCQQNGSHLCNVRRALPPIDGERSCATSPHEPRHFYHSSDSAPRPAPASRAVTESLNEPRNVLTTETA